MSPRKTPLHHHIRYRHYHFLISTTLRAIVVGATLSGFGRVSLLYYRSIKGQPRGSDAQPQQGSDAHPPLYAELPFKKYGALNDALGDLFSFPLHFHVL